MLFFCKLFFVCVSFSFSLRKTREGNFRVSIDIFNRGEFFQDLYMRDLDTCEILLHVRRCYMRDVAYYYTNK